MRGPISSVGLRGGDRVHREMPADGQERDVRLVQLADQAHVTEERGIASEVDARPARQRDDEPDRLAEVEWRAGRLAQSPAEWSACTIVTVTPRVSTVPPLFIPMISASRSGWRSSQRLSSWMQGQLGFVRRAIAGRPRRRPRPASTRGGRDGRGSRAGRRTDPRWTRPRASAGSRTMGRARPSSRPRPRAWSHAWPYQVKANPSASGMRHLRAGQSDRS